MRPVLISLMLLAAFSLSGAEENDLRFEKFMERSRKIFETNHIVVVRQQDSTSGVSLRSLPREGRTYSVA
jgi:hypothetical protein